MAADPANRPADPLARMAALGIAGVRIGIGVATFAASRRALKGLGFENPDAATVAITKLAGGRDIALGLHALFVHSDRERLREAVLLGAMVDAGDAIAFGSALVKREGIDSTALKNAPLGAGAAITGIWILRRL